jgi:hypothetical protein
MKSMKRPGVPAAESSQDQERSSGRRRRAKKKLMMMLEHLVSKIKVDLIQIHHLNIRNVKLPISQSWRVECWSERLREHALAAIA